MAIVAVGIWFVSPFANFSDRVAPAGAEFESNAGWIGVARKALLEHFELPLWNHYLGTGLPYLADPLSHFFSPLALAPALALGPLEGPRLAMILTIIASGLAQYYLGVVLGLSPPARLFGALLYMMNGQMLARFGLGHFDFGLAYPYMPLCYALLIKSIRDHRGLVYPVLGAASLAGLLFAGNVYYFVFALPGLAFATLLFAVSVRRSRPAIDVIGLSRAALIGVLGAGFSAVQWVPWVASRDLVYKAGDRFLSGSPEVIGSLHTLFEKSPLFYTREPGFGLQQGYIHEYYAYIGILIIPILLLAALAVFAGRRRAFILAFGLFTLYLLWASAAHTPFKYLYEAVPRLYDFRWTSRQMGLAMPFAALLASLGIDAVWVLMPKTIARLAASSKRWSYGVYAALGLATVAFSWPALKDVFEANQKRIYYAPRNAVHLAVGAWLKSDQDRPFLFHQFDGVGGMPLPYQQDGLKKSLANWGWELANTGSAVIEGMPSVRLRPPPRYWIQLNATPNRPDQELVTVVEDRAVYRFTESPPYAGFVKRGEAAERPETLGLPPGGGYLAWPWVGITAASAWWPSTNQVEVQGSPSNGQDLLLVLESFAPGWRLEIDGRRAGAPLNVGGLIAAEALEGEHDYVFVFDPAYARHGVTVTILALAVSWLLLARRPLSNGSRSFVLRVRGLTPRR